MTKLLSLFTILFWVLLVGKATKTEFFGVVPSWFMVFSPFLLQGISVLVHAWAISKGWDIKVDAWLWKAATRFRVFFIRRKVRREFKKDLAKRANPGKYVDPQNLGK